MDIRRLILFIALSIGLLLIWDKYIVTKPAVQPNQVQSKNQLDDSVTNQVTNSTAVLLDNSVGLASDKIIDVTTDLMKIQIDTLGGDIRSIKLLGYGSYEDPKQPYDLLFNSASRTFVAQTGLIGGTNSLQLPTHKTVFNADSLNYQLDANQEKLIVNLTSNIESNGIAIIKSFIFKRGSYVVDVNYQITNNLATPLTNLVSYWRFLRDKVPPAGQSMFVQVYTGPVYYNDQTKFNKVDFDKLAKSNLDYPKDVNNGWIGFIEHYFAAVWLLNPNSYPAVCNDQVRCHFNFKSVNNNLASAGVMVDLPQINPQSTYSISVPMYVGPQEYKDLVLAAPELERAKDYGLVHIFSTPLFWLLLKIFDLVQNWGVAIILLTLVVKIVLYPLTNASYKSMAKMKALAPKMERIKQQYADDKVKLQQAIMAMYREEKVNPLGGCLPMILQIPIFIGLYWALLSSVELRQASFLWVSDLSRPDPWFILPAVLTITMFLQTFLNPPIADPLQAKMMRIMPLVFGVMFFFFPAGLVVYWLVNNILSMAQQWYVNNQSK